MSLKEHLIELEKRKNELMFKQINENETINGDLTVRDATGIIPLYFRRINFDEAMERVIRSKPVTIIERDSELGMRYLKETHDDKGGR